MYTHRKVKKKKLNILFWCEDSKDQNMSLLTIVYSIIIIIILIMILQLHTHTHTAHTHGNNMALYNKACEASVQSFNSSWPNQAKIKANEKEEGGL